ncbi:hypothetical protein FRUB_01798 [Fimbriiglobus ruber]|uniref:Uncharacterized protein n=1 Tax=Fimbriiglobus ruber TaxID=1908690 RepID=A0A225EAN6_9BACT|nr:hypothetical protein FRUB_01798 [Fimbriiglobus ruber]
MRSAGRQYLVRIPSSRGRPGGTSNWHGYGRPRVGPGLTAWAILCRPVGAQNPSPGGGFVGIPALARSGVRRLKPGLQRRRASAHPVVLSPNGAAENGPGCEP